MKIGFSVILLRFNIGFLVCTDLNFMDSAFGIQRGKTAFLLQSSVYGCCGARPQHHSATNRERKLTETLCIHDFVILTF